jgi:hypothetical protein
MVPPKAWTPSGYRPPSGKFAEQIEKLLGNIFADCLFVRIAQRVRNVRVMTTRAAFTRSR